MSYEFDGDFQTKIAALALRDPVFNARVEGLIEPGYLGSEAEAQLVALHQRYWERYKTCASPVVMVKLLKEAIRKKIIREDMVDAVRDAYKALLKTDLSDRDYVVDEVAGFARHQAIINAMIAAADMLDKKDFDAIEQKMRAAFNVGAADGVEGHDLFGDAEGRSKRRLDKLTGATKSTITTGFAKLDDALHDGGFGRQELSVLMGGAKRGKSFGLMNFGVGAALAGYNVLHITLENSVDITTDRADAFLSRVRTKELLKNISSVEAEVKRRLAGAGLYKIHEYPTGTFAPKDLRRVLERYRAKGILFDEIVVDYWDIMAPDIRYRDDKIAESASIGVGLRAIAKEENAAVVTAIQTNRDGFKAHTAGAEHAAEDFNKVRLCDLMISINADDEERAAGLARLYFAAARNTEGGYHMEIEQDLATATFISKVKSAGSL